MFGVDWITLLRSIFSLIIVAQQQALQQQQQVSRSPQTQNYHSHYQQHNEVMSNGQDAEQEEPAYSQIRPTRQSQQEYDQDQYQRSHLSSVSSQERARPQYDSRLDAESEGGIVSLATSDGILCWVSTLTVGHTSFKAK